MRYTATVKTQAKQNNVQQISDSELKISVACPAQSGRANAQIVKLLSEHFSVPKWKVHITSGKKSPHKVIEVIQK